MDGDFNVNDTEHSLKHFPVIITHFKITSDKQQALLDVLIEDHERELRPLPSERVVEYLQFRSIEEFNLAQTHPSSKAHQSDYKQHAISDLHRRAYAGEFKPDSPLDLRVPLGYPHALL